MRLYVIFGHRREKYDGQYAPEALDVIDENGHAENPGWLDQRLAHHRDDTSFAAVEILEVRGIRDAEIMDALYPNRTANGAYIAPTRTAKDPTEASGIMSWRVCNGCGETWTEADDPAKRICDECKVANYDALVEERDRYQKALEQIAYDVLGHPEEICSQVYCIGRAALSGDTRGDA